MGPADCKHHAKLLKREIYTLQLACRDKRTPWYVKAIAICVVAYALSPIDLIPDPIPVLGHLDDLVLLPLGILLVRWLIPAEVWLDCRQQAETAVNQIKLRNWIAAGVIITLWLATILLLGWWLWR